MLNQHSERANAQSAASAAVIRNDAIAEQAEATGVYTAIATGPREEDRAAYVAVQDKIAAIEGASIFTRLLKRFETRSLRKQLAAFPIEEKWRESFHNVVTTEGKNSLLQHGFKGSSYTAAMFMGLIESTGYGFAGANGSGVAATNLAASITAAGGASPANGWNEAQSSQVASRGTPSFGTPSAGSLALSAAVSFSIAAAVTIRGCFMMIRSVAGVAPVATVGNTTGAIYSAGLFSGGDRTLAGGDTLNVSYTASL
jgi:hypothetical protein